MMMADQPTLSPSVLSWLRCFDAAARCASFSEAGKQLHVSQGAISQQVKSLEQRLKHVLLLRTPSGLQLTPEGKELFAATRESFSGLEGVIRRLNAYHIEEPVNVSCSPSFAMLWLTLRLVSLYRAHPHMALRVVGESERVDAVRLARDGVVGAVRFGLSAKDDPAAIDLLDEWLIPVAAPAFMEAHPELVTAHDLAGPHLLHAADPWEGGQPTEEWEQWLRGARVALPGAALRQGTQFNLALLAVQAALGGQGIAMGRLALVQGYLRQGRLVAPFKQRVRSTTNYRFIGNPSHPEMQKILDWLVDETGKFKVLRDAYFDSEKVMPV